jgi:AcrR family transcriptional regulator
MAPRKRAKALTQDEVVGAALEIIDLEGLDALTMRRLGADLGVEAMALYYHVPSKEALLDLTVERMRSEMRLPDPMPDNPATTLEAIFSEYVRVLRAHPNMAPLATRRTDRAAISGLEYLIGRGIEPDDAIELYQSITAFAVGFSILGSPLGESMLAGLPDDLTERMREWKDSTFRRTLRAVMSGYGLREGER